MAARLLFHCYSETLLPEVTDDLQDAKPNGPLPFLILCDLPLYFTLKFSCYLVSVIPHCPGFPLPRLFQPSAPKISLFSLAMKESMDMTV